MNNTSLRLNLVLSALQSGMEWDGTDDFINFVERLEEFIEGPLIPESITDMLFKGGY